MTFFVEIQDGRWEPAPEGLVSQRFMQRLENNQSQEISLEIIFNIFVVIYLLVSYSHYHDDCYQLSYKSHHPVLTDHGLPPAGTAPSRDCPASGGDRGGEGEDGYSLVQLDSAEQYVPVFKTSGATWFTLVNFLSGLCLPPLWPSWEHTSCDRASLQWLPCRSVAIWYVLHVTLVVVGGRGQHSAKSIWHTSHCIVQIHRDEVVGVRRFQSSGISQVSWKIPSMYLYSQRAGFLWY